MYDKQKGKMVYATEVEGLYLDMSHTEAHSMGVYKDESEKLAVLKGYSALPFVEEYLFVSTFRGREVNLFLYHPILATILTMSPALLIKEKVKMGEMFFGENSPKIQLSGRYSSQHESGKLPWTEKAVGVKFNAVFDEALLEGYLLDLEHYLDTYPDAIKKAREHQSNSVKVLSNTGSSLLTCPKKAVNETSKNPKFDSLDDKL